MREHARACSLCRPPVRHQPSYTMSSVVPPTHPEAQHFVLHEKKKAASKHEEPDENNGTDVQDAAINYLEAMAGFMGVVDAPKEADPEAEAAAAVAFLETLWGNEAVEVYYAGQDCNVKQPAVKRASKGKDSE
jgi:hypothetical protein